MAHLQLMGELALFDSAKAAERGEPLLSDVKPLVVPAYLALTPGRRARRDHIAELLWGGDDRRGARRSLRQALYVLSQHVEDPLVSSEGQHLSLVGIASCDVWKLEKAIGAGDHAVVVASSRRPLLENLADSLSDELREWIEVHETRRRTARRESTRALIDDAVANEDLAKAETLAQGWVAEEPLDEEPRAALIRVLAAQGESARAHGVYEEYRSLLHTTQDGEPSAELAGKVRELRTVLLEDGEWRSLASREESPLTRRSARVYAWVIFAAGLLVGIGVPVGISTCTAGASSSALEVDGDLWGGGEIYINDGDAITVHRPSRDPEGWSVRAVKPADSTVLLDETWGPFRTTGGLVWTHRVRRLETPPYPILILPGGDSIPIHRAEGDVGPAVPSPDGRRFLASVERPDAEPYARDLVLTTRDRAFGVPGAPEPRVLQTGAGTVASYGWAPDGLAIAAIVRDTTDRLIALRPSGRRMAEFAFHEVLGFDWCGGSRGLAAVVRDTAGTHALHIDLAGDTIRLVRARALGEAIGCSPDGSAVAYGVAYELEPGLEILDLATGERSLAPIPSFRSLSKLRWVPDRAPDFPRDLQIEGGADTLRWGEARTLGVRIVGPSDSSRIEDVTWISRDPWIASVDPDGTLFANQPGRTDVIATLHGWVADTLQVTVAGAPPERLVLQDRMETVDREKWIVVSHPEPIPVEVDGSRALWLRGDGRYSDGLVSAGSFTLADGATLQLEARFRPRRPTGERLTLCLVVVTTPPRPEYNDMGSTGEGGCIIYPGGELAKFDPGTARLYSRSGVHIEFPWPSPDASGWQRIGLEVRPDGVMSVRVDGQRLATTSIRLEDTKSTRWRASLRGASTDPPLLVRNLSVWLGPTGSSSRAARP